MSTFCWCKSGLISSSKALSIKIMPKKISRRARRRRRNILPRLEESGPEWSGRSRTHHKILQSTDGQPELIACLGKSSKTLIPLDEALAPHLAYIQARNKLILNSHEILQQNFETGRIGTNQAFVGEQQSFVVYEFLAQCRWRGLGWFCCSSECTHAAESLP